MQGSALDAWTETPPRLTSSAVGLDASHDPALQSWVASARGHAEFPIQNLPFGVFSPDGR